MEKIDGPLIRIIEEGNTVGFCEVCSSSLVRKYNILGFSFGRVIGCLQPDCNNFHLKDKTPEILQLTYYFAFYTETGLYFLNENFHLTHIHNKKICSFANLRTLLDKKEACLQWFKKEGVKVIHVFTNDSILHFPKALIHG